jgi:nicotinate-nucleotide adenylyltransferase
MREIERGGMTYTIDTLRDLRKTDPVRPLVLIMGSDQFDRRQTWHQWQQVSEFAHIAVAQRAGMAAAPVASNAGAEQLALSAGGCTVQFPMTPVDVSATEVRRLLREPQSTQTQHRLAAMVPAEVLDYIRRHNLYRKG